MASQFPHLRPMFTGPIEHLQNGTRPSVAITSKERIVLVYQKSSGPFSLLSPTTKLTCQVGKLRENLQTEPQTSDDIVWGAPTEFAEGMNPKVAANQDGAIVILFKTGRGYNYKVGVIQDDDTITWDGRKEWENVMPAYTTTPDVTLNNMAVIVAYSDAQSSNRVKFDFGEVDVAKKEIKWRTTQQLLPGIESCSELSISMNEYNMIVIVFIVKTWLPLLNFSLQYVLGRFDPSSYQIIFVSEAREFESGCSYPNVVLGNNNTLVSFHQAGTTAMSIPSYRYGWADMKSTSSNKTVRWTVARAREFGEGQYVSAAMSTQGVLVTVYETKMKNVLMFRLGQIQRVVRYN